MIFKLIFPEHLTKLYWDSKTTVTEVDNLILTAILLKDDVEYILLQYLKSSWVPTIIKKMI